MQEQLCTFQLPGLRAWDTSSAWVLPCDCKGYLAVCSQGIAAPKVQHLWCRISGYLQITFGDPKFSSHND